MKSMVTPFLKGAVRIHQPVNGYRFSIDSVLLAGFSRAKPGEKVLDLGTGCGVILLLMAFYYHLSEFEGIEIQPELADMAALGVEENGLSEIGSVCQGDMRDHAAIEKGKWDLVVCNPPYFQASSGKTSPDPARAFARQDIMAGLADVLRAAELAMKPGGRFCMIWPTDRLDEAESEARSVGLKPALIREVLPKPGVKSRVVLLQMNRKAKRMLELPPVKVMGKTGAYTEEVSSWLGESLCQKPTFFCDVMLGKLAKYFLLLGIDCAYTNLSDKEWLLSEIERSHRVLLTRDQELLNAAEKNSLHAFDPGEGPATIKLSRVLEKSGIEVEETLKSRCTECNSILLTLAREAAQGRVPPYTFLTHRTFTACPCCGRITWEGSHLSRFRKGILDKINEEIL